MDIWKDPITIAYFEFTDYKAPSRNTEIGLTLENVLTLALTLSSVRNGGKTDWVGLEL